MGYQFLNLSPDEKHARRASLDRNATIAQLSALVPIFAFLLYRLGLWLLARRSSAKIDYDVVPNSPQLKRRRLSSAGSWSDIARRVSWWLGDDIVIAGQSWGQRDQLIFGLAWTAWLMLLCLVNSGNDYLHLTKAFGSVAASQYPLQYLLALKNINPLVYVFNASHEQINRWHRVLGRIIYALLVAHGALYLNYWVNMNNVQTKIFEIVAILGILGLSGMTILSATALLLVRRYSYRVFYVSHVLVALALPLVLFFHVKQTRWYVSVALALFIIDMGVRRLRVIKAQATVETIPGTNLLKIMASMPTAKLNLFRATPGSHIYMVVPPPARPSQSLTSKDYLLFELLSNPFTVAAVDEEPGSITVVARELGGPMTKALRRLATSNSVPINVPLALNGPYGAAGFFPPLAGADFDRYLLVAGGVGATFILPLYRAIMSDNPGARVDMVWAIRGAGDATWAVTGEGKSILDDENLRLFLTGDILGRVDAAQSSAAGGNEVEMDRLDRDNPQSKYASRRNMKRPDLRKIVEDVFHQGFEDRVAVLVCGPEEMAREMRHLVGEWVVKGRNVWFHNESFAW